jgi:hypothetical protein
MNRKGKHAIRPTLVQTIASLKETETAFEGIDIDALRESAEEYYEREQGKFGSYLVSHGKLTRSQLEIALLKQSELAGDHDEFISRAKQAESALRLHARGIEEEASVILNAMKALVYDE